VDFWLSVVFLPYGLFWVSQEHSELPWLKSGIYAGGLFGFLATTVCVEGAFLYLIFGKDK
jgi:hypothetical protein